MHSLAIGGPVIRAKAATGPVAIRAFDASQPAGVKSASEAVVANYDVRSPTP